MTRTTFIYRGKGGDNYIVTKILHKAKKGTYKNDIIHLDILSSNKKRFGTVMTPREAVIVANSLLHAIIVNDEKKVEKRLRKKKK